MELSGNRMLSRAAFRRLSKFANNRLSVTEKAERSRALVAAVQAGSSMKAAGKPYGIGLERVRQILVAAGVYERPHQRRRMERRWYRRLPRCVRRVVDRLREAGVEVQPFYIVDRQPHGDYDRPGAQNLFRANGRTFMVSATTSWHYRRRRGQAVEPYRRWQLSPSRADFRVLVCPETWYVVRLALRGTRQNVYARQGRATRWDPYRERWPWEPGWGKVTTTKRRAA